MEMPDWASGRDREREREEIREDEWQKALDGGEEPQSLNIQREWSTVKEVAQRHGCSEKTIRKHRRDGALKAHAINPDAPPRSRRYRVHRDDELAWAKAKADVRKPRNIRTPATPTKRLFRERVK
jgi:transposase-like protein